MFKFKFSPTYEIEKPNIILSTCYHKHIGNISKYTNFNSSNNLSSANEISFDVYKEVDGKICEYWNDIKDFKYIFIPEYNEYYKLSVSLDESDETIKHITTKSACEWELSNRKISIEINTETDIKRDDYKIPTTFYNVEHPEASLLHRVLSDKCGDYTIAHVDNSLINIQRTFSTENTSIYDFLTSDVAKEIGCLFVFDSVNRTISVYDLYTVCNDITCGYRGEYSNKCPKCGGTNLYQYGDDTGIFISYENYAEHITIDGDGEKVKNCFKIEGGDDLITSTLKNINPNGSNYIYHFTEEMMSDMPDELVSKIVSYNALYESEKNNCANITNDIYNLTDKELELQSSMFPDIPTPSDTNAVEQLNVLISELKEVAVTDVNNISKTSSDLAVKGMARVIVDPRYDVEVLSSTLSSVSNKNRIWSGIFKITNQSNDEDIAQNDNNKEVTIISDNYEEYLEQKIKKTIDKRDLALGDIFKIENLDEFKNRLKEYNLDSLSSFESSYQSIIDVLVENGITEKSGNIYYTDVYNELYKPYYDKLMAIQSEIVVRENEIKDVVTTKNNKIKELENKQSMLDFKNYIGDLWNIFCLYLYEDIYSNSNYISDGLTNTELIDKAKELFNVAENELIKASELQLTLSIDIGDMLNDENFKPYLDKIIIGNWIRVRANDIIYKLRLITINISGDEFDNVSFEFSNVTKFKDGISDAQDLISKVQSITSSFDYVAHQSESNDEVIEDIEDMYIYGIDASNIPIVSDENQNVVYDKHGLLCRSYDDILGNYSPEQIKIINNTIAFTKDNWKTVSSALGKIKYTLNGQVYEDYGINTEHVIAGKVISGDIYSSNYEADKTGKLTKGTHFDLESGDFSLADGRIEYDSKENKMTLKQVELDWQTANIEDLGAIKSSQNYYGLSDSPDIPPDTWDDISPQWQEGKYIWQKTIYTYVDDTESESQPICIQGIKGQDGMDGIDGITSTIISSQGEMFNISSIPESTVLTCHVYKGGQEIEPISYTWEKMSDDEDMWEVIGRNKSIEIMLNSFQVKNRIRCNFEI